MPCIRTRSDSNGGVWIIKRSFRQACGIGNFQIRTPNSVYEFLQQVSSMSSWKRSFPTLTIICGELSILSGNVWLLSMPSVLVLFSVDFSVVTSIAYSFRNSFPVVFGLLTYVYRWVVCSGTYCIFCFHLWILSFFPIVCVVITASVPPNSRSSIEPFVSFGSNFGSSTSLAVFKSRPVSRRTRQTIRCSSMLCSKWSICARIVQ